ncbi:MAG: hypothetical protein AAF968_09790 [Pseudomonadota bacterium]
MPRTTKTHPLLALLGATIVLSCSPAAAQSDPPETPALGDGPVEGGGATLERQIDTPRQSPSDPTAGTARESAARSPLPPDLQREVDEAQELIDRSVADDAITPR